MLIKCLSDLKQLMFEYNCICTKVVVDKEKLI